MTFIKSKSISLFIMIGSPVKLQLVTTRGIFISARRAYNPKGGRNTPRLSVSSVTAELMSGILFFLLLRERSFCGDSRSSFSSLLIWQSFSPLPRLQQEAQKACPVFVSVFSNAERHHLCLRGRPDYIRRPISP